MNCCGRGDIISGSGVAETDGIVPPPLNSATHMIVLKTSVISLLPVIHVILKV